MRKARDLRLGAQWLDDHPDVDPETVMFHVDAEGNLTVHDREASG